MTWARVPRPLLFARVPRYARTPCQRTATRGGVQQNRQGGPSGNDMVLFGQRTYGVMGTTSGAHLKYKHFIKYWIKRSIVDTALLLLFSNAYGAEWIRLPHLLEADVARKQALGA